MMRLTITGPRSVGKSAVAETLARMFKVDYISPGLLYQRPSNNGNGAPYSRANLIYENNRIGFVLDLPGELINSREYPGASSRLMLNAKQNSVVVGLLPSGAPKRAIDFLCRKEAQKPKFRGAPRKDILAKIVEDYDGLPSLLKDFCNIVVYVIDKSPDEIAEEIVCRYHGKSQKDKQNA